MAFSRSAVALLMLSIAMSAVVDCTYEAGTGVTYDLNPLQNNEQDYRFGIDLALLETERIRF